MSSSRRYEDEAKYKPKMTIEREKGKGNRMSFAHSLKYSQYLIQEGLRQTVG